MEECIVNKKTMILVFILLLLGSITAVVVAHEQEGLMALQSTAFTAVAEKAAENSNAPRSHMPCVRGYAGEFPCNKVDLLSYVPSADLGGSFINDMWGWTDPETGTD